jgi:hypothetical protein
LAWEEQVDGEGGLLEVNALCAALANWRLALKRYEIQAKIPNPLQITMFLGLFGELGSLVTAPDA